MAAVCGSTTETIIVDPIKVDKIAALNSLLSKAGTEVKIDNKTIKQEVEMRFGKTVNEMFSPWVPKSTFENIKRKLIKDEKFTWLPSKQRIAHYIGNVRQIMSHDGTTWEKKKRLTNLDLENTSSYFPYIPILRFSLSTEEQDGAIPGYPISIDGRIRDSFVTKGYQIDMSFSNTGYTIEIELNEPMTYFEFLEILRFLDKIST